MEPTTSSLSATPTLVRRRRRWPVIVGICVALVVAALAVGYRPLFRGNVGEVDAGRVFRSAQPRENLDRLIAEHRLATVLNLRGGSPNDSWYANEVRVTRDKEVDFYDLPMGATRRPERAELLALLDLFHRCRYPLLIHCKSGSDRTGLASGLYLMAEKGANPSRALRELTIFYGHVPLLGPEKLHQPFHEYEAWLRGRSEAHSRERLREWVEHHYRATDSLATYEPPRPGPRVRR